MITERLMYLCSSRWYTIEGEGQRIRLVVELLELDTYVTSLLIYGMNCGPAIVLLLLNSVHHSIVVVGSDTITISLEMQKSSMQRGCMDSAFL